MSAKVYTVSRVARIAHVTVRTLHHYHHMGLLVPSRRSVSGYRLYSEEDLQRLQQILLFRQLGFSLEAIRRLLDEPAYDRRTALRAQRDLLRERVRQAETVIRAVDATLDALEGGRTMDATKMFDGFEGFDHAAHEDEARERWGDTDAYRESIRRTRSYGKDAWARIREEGEEVERTLAALLASGRSPEDPEAVDAAERARLHIDRWFYPCSREMHLSLGEMYLADPRFREHYEKRREGLAEFVAGAIRANAALG